MQGVGFGGWCGECFCRSRRWAQGCGERSGRKVDCGVPHDKVLSTILHTHARTHVRTHERTQSKILSVVTSWFSAISLVYDVKAPFLSTIMWRYFVEHEEGACVVGCDGLCGSVCYLGGLQWVRRSGHAPSFSHELRSFFLCFVCSEYPTSSLDEVGGQHPPWLTWTQMLRSEIEVDKNTNSNFEFSRCILLFEVNSVIPSENCSRIERRQISVCIFQLADLLKPSLCRIQPATGVVLKFWSCKVGSLKLNFLLRKSRLVYCKESVYIHIHMYTYIDSKKLTSKHLCAEKNYACWPE